MQGRSITVGDVVLYKGDGHDTRVGEVFFPCDAPGRTARLPVALAYEARSDTLEKSCRERRVHHSPFCMYVAVCHFYPNGGRTPVHGLGACLIDAPCTVCIRTHDPSVSDPPASVCIPYATIGLYHADPPAPSVSDPMTGLYA